MRKWRSQISIFCWSTLNSGIIDSTYMQVCITLVYKQRALDLLTCPRIDKLIKRLCNWKCMPAKGWTNWKDRRSPNIHRVATKMWWLWQPSLIDLLCKMIEARGGTKASQAQDKLLSHHFYPHRLYIVNIIGDFPHDMNLRMGQAIETIVVELVNPRGSHYF